MQRQLTSAVPKVCFVSFSPCRHLYAYLISLVVTYIKFMSQACVRMTAGYQVPVIPTVRSEMME